MNRVKSKHEATEDGSLTDWEGLTDRQKAFIVAYVGVCGFNATASARAAGYAGNDATLASVGYENLRKPEIMAVIRQILETKAATAEECLARISRRARGTMANAFKQVDGKYVISAEVLHETGEIHNIRKLKATANGDLEIELYDSMAADVAILRAYEKVSPAEEEVHRGVIILPDNGRGPVDWEQQRLMRERLGIRLPEESVSE